MDGVQSFSCVLELDVTFSNWQAFSHIEINVHVSVTLVMQYHHTCIFCTCKWCILML